MKYVLGLDGGGTKTECVLMDVEKTVCAQGRSGPSNPLRVGFGGALAAVCEAARWTMQDAKVAPDDIAALCAGLAGTAAIEVPRKIKKLLSEEYPNAIVHVCTDLELTLEATGEGPAIVLIAGTGSAAVGRDAKGHIARIGGHGPLLGDEGSAYDVGRRAAMHAMRDFDRTQTNSQLGTRILRETGMQDWTGFQSRATAIPDDVFPRIFSVAAAAAESGDATARRFLQDSACEFGALVRDMIERL